MGMRKNRPYLLAILSGLLVGTSYIPFPPWAVFFCFVPLWLTWLEEKSVVRIFWTGWTTQFVLTLIGFNWVTYTVHEFGHLPWWAAGITLLLFSSFANLHVPLAGITWHYCARKLNFTSTARIWTLPLFMSVGERIFPMIFDWHFGYTWLWAGFPAFHLADIVGFVGLSNIGIFINALVLMAWLRFRSRQSWIPYVATAAVVFLLLNGAGWLHGRSWANENYDSKLRLLVVQANVGNQEKIASEVGGSYRDEIINRYFRLTQQGLSQFGGADYVVWPETAFPEVMPDPELSFGFAAKLRELIKTLGTGLMTGGYSVQQKTDLYTNSFFILNKEGRWSDSPYHKTMLLAFGEYIPGGDWFPIFYDWLPYTGHFGRGPGPSVLNAEGLRVGAQICYEGLFDWFTRKLGQKDAQIIVNVTNDSWYGTWQQPFQHLYMTLARGIEVRRPLVRSTNTGISSVVLASGEILEPSPLHKEWFHLYEIPYMSNPKSTIFMSWGYWLIPTLLAALFAWAAVRGRE